MASSAVVTMLKEYLQGNSDNGESRSDNDRINAHVDHSAFKGDPGRPKGVIGSDLAALTCTWS